MTAAALGAGGFALWRDRSIERTVQRLAGDAANASRHTVPIGDSSHDGEADALVTVVEFSDFYCGYCSRGAAMRQQIKARYGGRVRWVFKHFPSRRTAAKAALLMADQGKFWPFADRLFASRRLHVAGLEAHARAVGADVTKLAQGMQSSELDARLERDRELGRSLGVRGTPTYFINGRRIVGYFPFAHFERVLLQEMEHARAALARRDPSDRAPRGSEVP